MYLASSDRLALLGYMLLQAVFICPIVLRDTERIFDLSTLSNSLFWGSIFIANLLFLMTSLADVVYALFLGELYNNK